MSDKNTYIFDYGQQPIRIGNHSSNEPQVSKDPNRMPPREQLECDRPDVATNSSPYTFSYNGPCPVHPKKKIRLVYDQEVQRSRALQLRQQQKIAQEEAEHLYRASAFTPYHELQHSTASYPYANTNNTHDNDNFRGVNYYYSEVQTEVPIYPHFRNSSCKKSRSPPDLIPISNVPPPLTPPMENPLIPTAFPLYSDEELNDEPRDLRVEVLTRIVVNKSVPSLDCKEVGEILLQVEDNKGREDGVSDSPSRHARSKDLFGGTPSNEGTPLRRSSCFKPPSGKDKHLNWLNSGHAGPSKPSSYEKSLEWLQYRPPSQNSRDEQIGTHSFGEQKSAFLEKSILEWNEGEVHQFWMDACSRMDLQSCEYLPSVTGAELIQMAIEDFKSVYLEYGEQFYYHFTAFQDQKSTKIEENFSEPSFPTPGSPQQEKQPQFSSPHLLSPHARYTPNIEDSHHSQHTPHSPHMPRSHPHSQCSNAQHDHPRNMTAMHHSPMQHHSAHHSHHHMQSNHHHSFHQRAPQALPHRNVQGYQDHYHAPSYPRSPSDEYVPQGQAFSARFDSPREWDSSNISIQRTDRHNRPSSSGLQGGSCSYSDSISSVSAMAMSHEADSDLASSDSEESWTEDKPRAPEKPIKRGPGRPRKPESERVKKPKKSIKVWQFFRNLLHNPETCPELIRWEDSERGVFRIVQSDVIARMWGMRKSTDTKKNNNTKMNYEKLSRAMRYHYKSKNLEAVLGKRLVYKFGENATGWRPKEPPNRNTNH